MAETITSNGIAHLLPTAISLVISAYITERVVIVKGYALIYFPGSSGSDSFSADSSNGVVYIPPRQLSRIKNQFCFTPDARIIYWLG